MSATAKLTIHRGLIGVNFGSSSLCSIDGDTGKLNYRNISIEQLAKTCCFEETVFLLLNGTLPSAADLHEFKGVLSQHRALPPSIHSILGECRTFPPIVALQVCLSALANDALGMSSEDEQALRLIGVTSSIICAHFALSQGRKLLDPDPELDHASDFYRRVTGKKPTVEQQRLINLDFVLHAEHGANASTTAMRVAAAAGSDLCGAATAALATLKGPRHGGAPGAIFDLIGGFDDPDQARAIVRENIANKKPVPGFGHRVYKVIDPRAVLYRAAIDRWMASTKSTNPSPLSIVDAMAEEMKAYQRMAIWPNDDLLAVALYSILEIPNELFVPLFAASRIAGWTAHYREAQDTALDGPLLHYEAP